MKQLLSLSLIAVFAAMLIVPVIPYIDYVMHKEHIVMHHCENPDSDCDGVCYLDKQLSHTHSNSGLLVQQLFKALFLNTIPTTLYIYQSPKVLTSALLDKTLDGFIPSIFEPPQS